MNNLLKIRFALPFGFLVAAIVSACGPGGTVQDEAPAVLVVEPQVLTFGSDVDTETVLVKNDGGRTLTFSVQVSAQTDNIDWLKVSPEAGSVEGGGVSSLRVDVVNRDLLLPQTYQGKVIIVPEDLDPVTVNVTVEVGQPILSVEPSDVLDFGAEGEHRNLIFKNVGAGKLQYAIDLPTGGWLSTESVLQKEILANEPQTVKLTVDRSQVPWYGNKSDEIVVTSNGLDGDSYSSTVKIEVQVTVDDSCEVDANCTKIGYFCKVIDGVGTCEVKKEDGQICAVASQCKSGVCDEGLCCDASCEGQCRSCALPDFKGTCTDLPKDSVCDDGLLCTTDDSCLEGECQAGEPVDCSSYTSDCASGECDPETGECFALVTEGSCHIQGVCYEAGETDPGAECMVCSPATSSDDWTVADGKCYVDESCYSMGESVGADGCLVCNPAKPLEASIAGDGDACQDDGNGCTDDVCQGGICVHPPSEATVCNDDDLCTSGDQCKAGQCFGEPYVCKDELDCTEDACLGDGECDFQVLEGFCLIDDMCYSTGLPGPGTYGCSVCQPGVDQEDFTDMPDGQECSDGNPCTLDDECSTGVCQGKPKVCDDGLFCTEDSCEPVSGECTKSVLQDWCLIDGECYGADSFPPGPDGGCLACKPQQSQGDWIAVNEDQKCDDLSPCSDDSVCKSGDCVPIGQSCDDGLYCTVDKCTVNNDCEHELVEGFCVIDGKCQAADAKEEGSAGCSLCQPLQDPYGWSAAPPETGCSDGDPCTDGDQCQQGVCQGLDKDCDDKLFCTDDECVAETGTCLNDRWSEWCIIDGDCRQDGTGPLGKDEACKVCDALVSPFAWLPHNHGSKCDDLSDCTSESVCDGGACIGVGPLCDDDNECTVDKCAQDGKCTHGNVSDDTPCGADDIGCTEDVCIAGECKHPVMVGKCLIDGDCLSVGDVHADTVCLGCSEASPTKWASVSEGGACVDGEWCTVEDMCTDGVCAGQPRDCGGNPCNAAVCQEDVDECQVSPKPDNTACDDLDPCTDGDECLAGMCEGEPKDCSGLANGNDCLQAFCDPASEPQPGECKVLPFDLGAPCDDGLFCNVDEGCDGDGKCEGGTPRDCDQFGQCFTGICDDEADECVPEQKSNGTLCNADEDGCTEADSCQDGVCKPGAAAACDNVADTCNLGICTSLGADNYSCAAEPKGAGTICDDDLFCTDGEECDGGGNCGGGLPKDCSYVLQGADCKTATCDEISNTCVQATAPNGYVCDDGIDCTLEDTCTNGVCVGGMNGCTQRKLNYLTQGSDPPGFPFVPKIINLGQGDILTMWRNTATSLTSRIVDRELSKSWIPITASYGEDFPTGNCFSEITQAGAAARSTGEWVVAMGYRWGKAWDAPWPVVFERKVSYRISFAAYDKNMKQVKSFKDLWQGAVFESQHSWQPQCSDLPSNGSGWPADAVEVFSFSDGAFGILVKIHETHIPQYYPISAGFQAGANKGIGNEMMNNISGCVLPNNNIVLVWHNNGYAGAGVANRNMDWVVAPFFVSQNSDDDGHQYFPQCGTLPNGKFVVAFNSYANNGPSNLYLQVFNSSGTKYGGVIKPNTGGGQGHTIGPSAFSDGSFVMTWQQEGFDSDKIGIGARIYSKSYNATTNAFLVNTQETGNQFWPLHKVDGDEWLAVWTNKSSQAKYDFFFRRFTKDGDDAAGAPERRANQDTAGNQESGEATNTSNGAVMVFESDTIDGDQDGVALRYFAPDGAPSTGDIQVNTTTAGSQTEPAVAYNQAEDRVMVVWTSPGKVENLDIVARIFSAEGLPVTNEIVVNTKTSGPQYEPSVGAAAGGFVVAWTDKLGVDGNDIRARSFDAAGQPMSDEFPVNNAGSGDQKNPIVLSYGSQSDLLVVTWLKSGGSGQDGVYLRQLKKDGTTAVDDVLVGGANGISGYSANRHANGTIAACWQAGNVSCRKVDSQLKPSGSAFTVGESNPARPAVVVRDTNRFWVFYDRSGVDQSGLGLVREEVDAQGNRLRFPILVNWHEPGSQTTSFAAPVDPDNVLIGWQSTGQDGAGEGIYFRVLD